MTVARTLARAHWSSITITVVVSLMVASFISGGLTVAGIVLSLLGGWISGLAVRYANRSDRSGLRVEIVPAS